MHDHWLLWLLWLELLAELASVDQVFYISVDPWPVDVFSGKASHLLYAFMADMKLVQDICLELLRYQDLSTLEYGAPLQSQFISICPIFQ